MSSKREGYVDGQTEREGTANWARARRGRGKGICPTGSLSPLCVFILSYILRLIARVQHHHPTSPPPRALPTAHRHVHRHPTHTHVHLYRLRLTHLLLTARLRFLHRSSFLSPFPSTPPSTQNTRYRTSHAGNLPLPPPQRRLRHQGLPSL